MRRLLAVQHPQWAELPLTPVPSAGTDNALFRLGADLVVRLPVVDWAVDDVAKEQHVLPLLAPHLPLPVPEPVAGGEPGAGFPWPWWVYRWLPGRTPLPADDVAADLARFVVALRSASVAAGPAASRGGPLAPLDAQVREQAPLLADLLDPADALAVWEQALEAPPWDGPPVWVHGDLGLGNLLVDEAGRLSAVIDWGACGVGDPAVDLFPAWLWASPGRDAYRAAVDVDDATWERGRGRALAIALAQLSYYRESNRVLAAQGATVLRSLLGDGAVAPLGSSA